MAPCFHARLAVSPQVALLVRRWSGHRIRLSQRLGCQPPLSLCPGCRQSCRSALVATCQPAAEHPALRVPTKRTEAQQNRADDLASAAVATGCFCMSWLWQCAPFGCLARFGPGTDANGL